jgi:putative endonuclease
MWYLYIVQCSDGTLYTGITTNIARRLDEHNNKKSGAKYTKSRRPVVLVYRETYATRSEAQKAEYQIKRLTRRQKINLTKGEK